VIFDEVWEWVNTLRVQTITGQLLQSTKEPISFPSEGNHIAN
jgi:hypothetical protein